MTCHLPPWLRWLCGCDCKNKEKAGEQNETGPALRPGPTKLRPPS